MRTDEGQLVAYGGLIFDQAFVNESEFQYPQVNFCLKIILSFMSYILNASKFRTKLFNFIKNSELTALPEITSCG